MNSNIQPYPEYVRRWETLCRWAKEQGIPVVEGVYDEGAWAQGPGAVMRAGAPCEDRCRVCYRMRLEEAARYAQEHGFEAISTTLAVSPYQLSEICHEELQKAARSHGLECVWEDFRPYYPEATRRSRALGMYRQNYCGCLVSKAEADTERAQRKREKAAARAAREAEEAPIREEKKRQRAAYEAKQHAKREARDRARAMAKMTSRRLDEERL